MSRTVPLLLLASVTLFVFGPTGAIAASPGAEECTASGGTYTKEGSTATCTSAEQSVASPNANPDNNGQTTQTTTTGQGNLDNKTVGPTCSSGPPGQCK